MGVIQTLNPIKAAKRTGINVSLAVLPTADVVIE